MSNSISNGLSQDITVQAGQSIKFAWLGGTYTARIVAGAAALPVALATNSAANTTFGPYATPVVIRLTVSAIGRVAWSADASPAFIPPGETVTRQDDGITVTLSGVGPAAAFSTGGSSVLTQTTRTGAFTLVAADSGTIIPVTGAFAVTLNAASDLTAPVEIRRYDAAALTVTMTGVTVIDPSTGAAWGTLGVNNKLSSIVIYPGSVADEYGAAKVGA